MTVQPLTPRQRLDLARAQFNGLVVLLNSLGHVGTALQTVGDSAIALAEQRLAAGVAQQVKAEETR